MLLFFALHRKDEHADNSFFTRGFLWSSGAAIRSDDLQTVRFGSTMRSTCIAWAAYQTFTHHTNPLKTGQIFSIRFKTLYVANANENKLEGFQTHRRRLS